MYPTDRSHVHPTKGPIPKERLDSLLVDKGLAPSRQKAQAMIMAGEVEVDGVKVTKPGQRVPVASLIRVASPRISYVSRGGLKLEAALDHFGIHVEGLVVLDVGASTGGFTHCLLERGAARVIALDVGHGQLHQRLRQDPRVTVMERCNVRHLAPEDLDQRPDMATIDVSFISLRIVLPAVARLVGTTTGRGILALVKPQFEVGRKEVGRRGVVTDPCLHARVLQEVSMTGEALGFSPSTPFACPILGPKGNREFFIWFRKTES